MSQTRVETRGEFEEKGEELHFVVSEEAETALDIELQKKLKDFKVKRQGASILFYAKADGALVSIFKPYDTTQLLIDPRAYEIAPYFGTKQFLCDKAAEIKPEQNAGTPIKFGRDVRFSLEVDEKDIQKIPQTLNLEEVLKLNQETKASLYNNLANLFQRCADFLPSKMAEFADRLDKLCRFNLDNSAEFSPITDQIFLMNGEKISGTMSATIHLNKNGHADVYLYDEVVDYLSLCSKEELDLIKQYQEELDVLKKQDDKQAISAKEAQIDAITAPKRKALTEILFNAMRVSVNTRLAEMRAKLPQENLRNDTNAFIRAASGREQMYKDLGCANDCATHVIHAPRSAYTDKLKLAIDNQIKQQFAPIVQELNSMEFNKPMSMSALIGQNRQYGSAITPQDVDLQSEARAIANNKM